VVAATSEAASVHNPAKVYTAIYSTDEFEILFLEQAASTSNKRKL
jgi:hypothetical protein